MEKDDKGSTLIRIGVSGESSFWYRPTRVVPDQRPLNGRCSARSFRIMTNLFWFCLELDTFQSCMLLLLHPTMTQLTFMQDEHFKPQYTAQHDEMGSRWFININPVPTFAYMQLQFIA